MRCKEVPTTVLLNRLTNGFTLMAVVLKSSETNMFPGCNSRDYYINQDLTGQRWHSKWTIVGEMKRYHSVKGKG